MDRALARYLSVRRGVQVSMDVNGQSQYFLQAGSFEANQQRRCIASGVSPFGWMWGFPVSKLNMVSS
jgi:hypothetical protein